MYLLEKHILLSFSSPRFIKVPLLSDYSLTMRFSKRTQDLSIELNTFLLTWVYRTFVAFQFYEFIYK